MWFTLCHFYEVFDNLIEDTEGELNKLCAFVGIAFDARMLDGRGLCVPQYSAAQHRLVGRSPDTSRVHVWNGFVAMTDS